MTDKKPTKVTMASLKRKLGELQHQNKILSEANSELIPIAAEVDAVREQLSISRAMAKEAKDAYTHYKQESYKQKAEAERFRHLKSTIQILHSFSQHESPEVLTTAHRETLSFLIKIIDGEA